MVNAILFAIPFFFLLIGIEMFIARLKKKKVYRLNDSITNLNIGIGNQLFNTAFKVVVLGVYVAIYNHIAIFHIPPTWWSFVLALLCFDFIFYWAHRWGHTVNFFWGAHVVHHSSEEYNLSVALRQPWFHNMIAFFLFLPLPMLGFDRDIFFLAAAVHTLYQFWIHTRLVDRLPKPIEYIFNTPSHHRVHHGVNPKYIDKNYAGVFMIWDRMFGTFMAEEEEPTYGITTQLKSWNPSWANVHFYADMIRQARQMTNLKDKLHIIFAKPGWLPKELGGFQTPPEVDKENYRPYDTSITWVKKVYVLAQFVLIAVGISMYMSNYDNMSLFYKTLFFFVILISLMICGGIFENRKWVIYAEYGRLLLVGLSLNTFYYYWYIDWFAHMLIISYIAFVLFTIWFSASWVLEREVQPQPVRS